MKFVALASFIACAAFMVAALVLSSASGVFASDSECIQSRDNSQDIHLYNGSNATIISNPSNIQSCG
jgi:hypothetical protein